MFPFSATTIKVTSFLFCYCVFFIIYLPSCNKEKNTGFPELETKKVTDITGSSAVSGGVIISEGRFEISSKGVCWSQDKDPDVSGNHTEEGKGDAPFVSIITRLLPNNIYQVRSYATNSSGTAYGQNETFRTVGIVNQGQIIADHTVVDKYDKIPQKYIDEVKKMWTTNPGESHTAALRQGLVDLELLDSRFQVLIRTSGTPSSYRTSELRFSSATWGDLSSETGWKYGYGEEDWFTNSTAITRTKAGIRYCNTHDLELTAIGFGWCYDDSHTSNVSDKADPVYGCRWYGRSYDGPEGNRCWGLDESDKIITGNSVCLDTYLVATQEYIDYCASQGYKTKVYFTTGPVEPTYYKNEAGYQASLKHQRIRDYVLADPSRILFDYADILCYDDGNEILSTATWNGHTFPVITSANYGKGDLGHIGSDGALRLAKAM